MRCCASQEIFAISGVLKYNLTSTDKIAETCETSISSVHFLLRLSKYS